MGVGISLVTIDGDNSFASCSNARNSGEGGTPSYKSGLYLLDHGDLDVTTGENEEASCRQKK